jgi:hypothetical protein
MIAVMLHTGKQTRSFNKQYRSTTSARKTAALIIEHL